MPQHVNGENIANAKWSVEERCISKPIVPPQDWSYDGTILMTGYAGIHGVNADWETPHVLTFLNDSDLWGGALSLDGQWYASPRGDFTITETYNGITGVDELRVFSVDRDRDYFYSLAVDRAEYVFFGYTHAQVYWRDNETFLYANTEFSPFRGESTDWPTSEYNFDGQPHQRFYFSPDWTRWIFNGLDEQNHSVWKISDLTQNKILEKLDITVPIAWNPDASAFVATITDGQEIPSYSFALFDRQGNPLETIFAVPVGQQLGLFTLGWSPNGRYLAFITFENSFPWNHYSPQNTLYIADVQNSVIYNTCVAIGEGLAWSPNSNIDQLTFLVSGEGTKEVLILDMNSYSLYSIARHLVSYNRRVYQGRQSAYDGIVGWREN